MKKDFYAKMVEEYHTSPGLISRVRKNIGLPTGVNLNKEQLKKVEAAIRLYKTMGNITKEKRIKIVKKELAEKGYIELRLISKLLNGRHVSTSVKTIEKEIGIEVYDDVIKVLRPGKTKDSKSPDEFKYKNVKVYRSLTALFAEWKDERTTGPAKNGDNGNHGRNGGHRIC